MILTQDVTKTGSQWGVSLTSSNPEPEDHIACASREDAERLIDHCKGLQNCATAYQGRLEEILTALEVEGMDPETTEEEFQAFLGTVRTAMKPREDCAEKLKTEREYAVRVAIKLRTRCRDLECQLQKVAEMRNALMNHEEQFVSENRALKAERAELLQRIDALNKERDTLMGALRAIIELKPLPAPPQPAPAPSGAPPGAV